MKLEGETGSLGLQSYVGMGGGKGTVTPLLKGKVRIPPPAEHFVDPSLSREKFFDPPLCHKKLFFHTASKKSQKMVPKNCKITHFFNQFPKLP